MIKEAYCSYEVAKLLKEKGFNELCYCHEFTDYEGNFTTYHTEYPENWNQSKPCVSIPTLGMAMAWLRTKHIIIVVQPEYFNADGICSYWGVDIWADDNYEKLQGDFPAYEEAVEAALKYSLENLI